MAAGRTSSGITRDPRGRSPDLRGHRRPAQYFEIGSGHSTKFARHEIDAGGLTTTIDVVLYDGSHRVFQNSDTTVFFLEVLPRLAPGVLVHIHDIFCRATTRRHGWRGSIRNSTSWPRCCWAWCRHFGSG